MNYKSIDNSGLVSVFTPTYNTNPNYLKAVLDSLVKQTYSHWEWVIFDDSDYLLDTNEGVSVANLIADFKNSKIRYFTGLSHSGKIGEVKANAAALCRGDIIVELDHDDLLHPLALEKITSAFNTHPKTDFIYTNFCEPFHDKEGFKTYPTGWGMGFGAHHWEYDEDLKKQILVMDAPNINAKTVSHIVGVPNHARVWRRTSYEALHGHNYNLEVADDYELIVRTILSAESRIVKLPQMLYMQYTHSKDKTTSQTKNKLIQETWKAIYDFYRHNLESLFMHHGQNPLNISDKPYYEYPTHVKYLNKVWNDPVMPRVGIVVSTYDRVDGLKRALESIAAQTFRDFEIYIVGDNCPTLDKTMQNYQDPKIKWWNLSKNYNDGGTTPKNYALKMLFRNKLVAYLDDDNTWEPNHLQSLIESLGDDKYFAFSSFKSGNFSIKCSEPKRYRIDTSALLHRYDLFHFGFWKTRAKAGYAHDWELVSRWVTAYPVENRWAATKLFTLNFDNTTSKQDMKGIKDFYNDQD